MKMCDMNPNVRPYERLEMYGSDSLSDEELLAILIRSGTKGNSARDVANHLLSSSAFTSGLAGLATVSIEELSEMSGIGRVKAIQLKACFEIGKRAFSAHNNSNRLFFNNTETAQAFFESKMSFLESEEVHVALLDTKNRLMAHDVICRGGIDNITFVAKEMFRLAVRINASGVIIAHNHPSGDAVPSKEDVATTMKLIECGRTIGISILDHIVVGKGCSFSMINEGLIEEK